MIELWSEFLSYEPLPELMQGAFVALFSLFSAFAIGILFQIALSNKEFFGQEIYTIDLMILLEKVVRFRMSLIILLIGLLFPFFMSFENFGVRTGIFLIWLISFGVLLWVIIRTYLFATGQIDKHKLREDYFKELASKDDFSKKRIRWRQIWEARDISNVEYFFKKFQKDVNGVIYQEQWEKTSSLLQSFLYNLESEQRVLPLLYRTQFMSVLIEWQYQLWYTEYVKEKGGSQYFMESDIILGRIMDGTLQMIIENRKDNPLDALLDRIDKSIAQYEETEEGGQFIESLAIPNAILKYGEQNPDYHQLWHHRFPERWQVTKDNVESNYISNIWFEKFKRWAQPRINRSTDTDRYLDMVNEYLFPEVDHSMWAKIVTLMVRGYSPDESRITQVVEHPPQNFGMMAPIVVDWVEGFEDGEEEYQKEITQRWQNTVELAYVILRGKLFTPEKIAQWYQALDNTKTQEIIEEERRKWLHFLNDLNEKFREKGHEVETVEE